MVDVPTVTTQKNISQLPPASAPLTGNEMVMADLTVAGPTAKLTLAQLAVFFGTGFADAPSDGTAYARQSGAWTNAPSFGGKVTAPDAKLTFADPAWGQLQIDTVTGVGSDICGSKNNSLRWQISLPNQTNEAGSNVGSDFTVQCWADDGATLLGTPFSITRANGAVTVSILVLGVGGPFITSGTGVPSTTQPKGSLFLRTDGAVGSTLYVSQGAGTWNAVAGV